MTEIFLLLATLPDVPKPLNALPGCYERDLPDGWHVKVNAHLDKRDGVPPFHALFVNDDEMLAAVVSPIGGSMVFDCEDRIIAALKAAGAALP